MTKTTAEVAAEFVALLRADKEQTVYETLYSPDIVSVEQMPGPHQMCEGMAAKQAKNEWWEQQHEVHRMEVSDPLVADGYFAVRFDLDMTHKPSGQRHDGDELALYTVKDGLIVREEYFYPTGQ